MMETLFDSKTLFLPPNHSAIYTARIAATCVDIFLLTSVLTWCYISCNIHLMDQCLEYSFPRNVG